MAASIKDETYFMETLVFQVENYLFKVPRYQFENSKICGPILLRRPPEEEEPEGSSEATPCKLEGFSATDFRNFLSALYPLSYPPPELSNDQWASVLKLSTKWMFLDLRRSAIAKLLSLPITPQTILLGLEYYSIELFTAGCSTLVFRTASLSEDEAMELGYKTAFRLGFVREKNRDDADGDELETEFTRIFERQILDISIEEELSYGLPETPQTFYKPRRHVKRLPKRRRRLMVEPESP